MWALISNLTTLKVQNLHICVPMQQIHLHAACQGHSSPTQLFTEPCMVLVLLHTSNENASALHTIAGTAVQKIFRLLKLFHYLCAHLQLENFARFQSPLEKELDSFSTLNCVCVWWVDVYGLMLKSAAEEYCTLFSFFSLVFQYHVCATFFEFLSISFSWIYALDSIQIFQLPLSQIRVVYIKFW
jgi:hypothetical protein